MLEPISPTPDRKHELGNQLFWPIATVAPRLRQASSGECRVKSQVVEHPFHDCHATPGCDLFVGKTQVKTHDFLRT
jgi:hypothetical protein